MPVIPDSDSEDDHGLEDGVELNTQAAAGAPTSPTDGGVPSPSLRQSLRERGGRPAQAEEEGAWLADRPLMTGDSSQGATEQEATLNLLNSLLGNSLLALPWAFAQVGLVLGVVLLFLGTALNRYTLHLLLKHVDMPGGGSYPRIGRCAYGGAGEAAVLGVYLIVSGGALCAYAVGLSDLVSELFGQVGLGGVPRLFVGLIAVGICAPGMFQRTLKRIAKFSALNLVASVIFSLVLVSFVFLPSDPYSKPQFYAARQENLLVAWPIFGYVFAVQPSGVLVLSKLEASETRRNTPDNMDDIDVATVQEARHRVSAIAYIIAVTVGTLCGISSFMRFGELTHGNILESCHESHALLWAGSLPILQLCSSVMLLSSAAFVMVPFRFAVIEIMRLSELGGTPVPSMEEVPEKLRKQITCCMLAIMLIVAVFCDDISTVYRIIGSFATQLFALILPGAFALRLAISLGSRRNMVGPALVTVFGVLSILLCVAHMSEGVAG